MTVGIFRHFKLLWFQAYGSMDVKCNFNMHDVHDEGLKGSCSQREGTEIL